MINIASCERSFGDQNTPLEGKNLGKSRKFSKIWKPRTIKILWSCPLWWNFQHLTEISQTKSPYFYSKIPIFYSHFFLHSTLDDSSHRIAPASHKNTHLKFIDVISECGQTSSWITHIFAQKNETNVDVRRPRTCLQLFSFFFN